MKKPTELIECDCCGSYHRRRFEGDCRQDNERFSGAEDYTQRTGRPAVEVWA